MSDSPSDTTEIGYADAMAELESILDDLEDDDLDVDVLAGRVERASTLIALCRERIGSARVQVEKIVASLDAPPADRVDGDGDSDSTGGPSSDADEVTLDLDGE